MSRTLLAIAPAVGLLLISAGVSRAQDRATGSAQTQKINELIAKGWVAGGIKKPAEHASDEEFMRRVFIDLIGRIPTPIEILDFAGESPSPNKRARLVFRLLNEQKYTPRGERKITSIPGLKSVPINYNDAYAEHFAELWTTWMLTRSNTLPLYRDQFETYLASQFASSSRNPDGKPWNEIVQEIISASGKTNENGAVVFVIRHLGEPIVTERGQKADFVKDGKFDAVPITSRVTKLFLGIQSQCVQCHDHPHNKEYVQSDFWGVNAFFRQADRSGTTNPRNLGNGVTPPQITLTDMPAWNNSGMVLYERRDGQRKASFASMIRDIAQFQRGESPSKRLVSGTIPENLAGKTRRQILAQWLTEHDNFAKAFVNRMWGHLFGRGLNKEPSVDDFSSENTVVHPELLNYLAEEFKKYNYDPKKLLEWICTSDVYNLSHVANKEYAAAKYNAYFARMPLKAMSPEVLFDSLALATRMDGTAKKTLKDSWGKKLTQNFGDDEGNEMSFNGTVVQALLMMNGREINGEIGSAKGRGDGVVADVVKRHTGRGSINVRGIYDELFLMTVSRKPTDAEVRRLNDVRDGRSNVPLNAPPPKGSDNSGVKPKPKPKGPAIPVPFSNPDDVSFYQDVFWALLNSNEFILNH